MAVAREDAQRHAVELVIGATTFSSRVADEAEAATQRLVQDGRARADGELLYTP